VTERTKRLGEDAMAEYRRLSELRRIAKTVMEPLQEARQSFHEAVERYRAAQINEAAP
jgi:hypothetical protein